jgi:putative MFS transporter
LTVSLGRHLDDLPVSRFHWRLRAVTWAGEILDGMDVGFIGYALPGMIATFALSKAAAGLIASVGLAGLFFGSTAVAIAADRVGRRALYQWSLAVFSLGSLLVASASSYGWLLFVRFVSALGLGSEIPLSEVYVAEFSPSRVRGRFVALVTIIVSVGLMISGAVAIWAVPVFGWRGLFVIGAVPVLLILPARRWLPESVRYMELRGRTAEAVAVVNGIRAESGLPPVQVEPGPAPSTRRGAFALHEVARLWHPQLRRTTGVVWAAFAFQLFTLWGMQVWLPTILISMGYGVIRSFALSLVISAGGLLGGLLNAWLVEVSGRRRLWLADFSLAFLAVLAVSWAVAAHQPLAVLVSLLVIAQVFTSASGNLAVIYATDSYPTELRASGTGMGLGVGRLSSIAAPFLAGLLLDAHAGPQTVFLMFSIPMLLGAVAVAALARETRGVPLQQVLAGAPADGARGVSAGAL